MNSRYFNSLRLCTILSPMKRAKYLKKHHIFKHIGDNVMIMSRMIPLYPRLISIGNNVWIASNVKFITHDVCHYMLNGIERNKKNDFRFSEKLGCIEVGNNVFIGANVTILYDVKIGNNVVIAAGSLVNKDIPDNTVFGGVPAKKLGEFNDFYEKRKRESSVKQDNKSDKNIEEQEWEDFYEKRDEI